MKLEVSFQLWDEIINYQINIMTLKLKAGMMCINPLHNTIATFLFHFSLTIFFLNN